MERKDLRAVTPLPPPPPPIPTHTHSLFWELERVTQKRSFPLLHFNLSHLSAPYFQSRTFFQKLETGAQTLSEKYFDSERSRFSAAQHMLLFCSVKFSLQFFKFGRYFFQLRLYFFDMLFTIDFFSYSCVRSFDCTAPVRTPF